MHWLRRHQGAGRPPHPDILTPAEWRVLEHVREGLPNAEIAVRLGVSINTVRTHVSSMLAKLELPDRHALAAWDGTPSEASRHHLERTRFALPLGDWPSVLRFVAGGGAAAVGVFVLWFAIGMAQDGGPGHPGSLDLSEGHPPEGIEQLAAATVDVGQEAVEVTGTRSPDETRIEVALPVDMELLGGPQLIHRNRTITASTLERTPEGILATFPVTASGSDLRIELGPAVRVVDGEPFVLTLAARRAIERARGAEPCPDHLPYALGLVEGDIPTVPIEPADVIVGPIDVVYEVDCGAHAAGITDPNATSFSVSLQGTWHPEYGLLTTDDWLEDLAHLGPNALEPMRENSDVLRVGANAFDAAGNTFVLIGSGHTMRTDAEMRPEDSFINFQFLAGGALNRLDRVTLLLTRDPDVVIDGDHAVILETVP